MFKRVSFCLFFLLSTTHAFEFELKSKACRLIAASTKHNGIKSYRNPTTFTAKCEMENYLVNCHFIHRDGVVSERDVDFDIINYNDKVLVLESEKGFVVSIDLLKLRFISKEIENNPIEVKELRTLFCAGTSHPN